MKAHRNLITRIMTLVLGFVLCGLPEVAQALPQQCYRSAEPTSRAEPPSIRQWVRCSPCPVKMNRTPSQNTEVPPEPVPATPAPQPRAEQQMQQPLGAATAEGVPTVGGGASRPAGEAIAPAKQNQRRSMLIKIGLSRCCGCRRRNGLRIV